MLQPLVTERPREQNWLCSQGWGLVWDTLYPINPSDTSQSWELMYVEVITLYSEYVMPPDAARAAVEKCDWLAPQASDQALVFALTVWQLLCESCLGGRGDTFQCMQFTSHSGALILQVHLYTCWICSVIPPILRCALRLLSSFPK